MKIYLTTGIKGKAEIDEFLIIGVFLRKESAENAVVQAKEMVKEELKKPCPVSKAAAKKYDSWEYEHTNLDDKEYDKWIDWKLNYLRANSYDIESFGVEEFDTEEFLFKIKA